MARRTTKGRFTAKAGGAKKAHRHAKSGKRHGKRVGRRSAAFGGKRIELFGIDVMQVGIGGIGAIVSGAGASYAANALPMAEAKTGGGKLLVRAAITAVAGMAAHKFLPRSISGPLLVGAGVGLGIDVLNTFVMPHLPQLHGLSGYAPLEDQLAALEIEQPGSLSGLLATDTASQPVFSLS